MTAHWGVPDPAAAEGTHEECMKAFRDTLHLLQTRISLLINLPAESLDRLSLQQKARAIGMMS